MSDRLPLLLKISEAMAELSCSRSHLYDLIDRGDLTRVRGGPRFVRVTSASVRTYAAKCQQRRRVSLEQGEAG